MCLHARSASSEWPDKPRGQAPAKFDHFPVWLYSHHLADGITRCVYFVTSVLTHRMRRVACLVIIIHPAPRMRPGL